MDSVRSGLAGGSNMLGRVEVGRDRDRLAGDAAVERSRIVRSGDGDGLDPELAAGAEDAHCDLASIRDE